MPKLCYKLNSKKKLSNFRFILFKKINLVDQGYSTQMYAMNMNQQYYMPHVLMHQELNPNNSMAMEKVKSTHILTNILF